MATRSENIVIQGRFVWINMHTPRTKDKDGKPLDNPKYEVTVLVPKQGPSWDADPNFLRLWQLVMDVNLTEFKTQQLVGRCPLKDGDNPRDQFGNPNPAMLEKYPWYRGNWYFTATTQRPPGPNQIVGPDNQPLMPNMLKGGDWGSISVNAWSFTNGNRGINFGVEMLRKERDGDPIGNGGEGRDPGEVFGAPVGPALAPPLTNAPYAPGGYPQQGGPAMPPLPPNGAQQPGAYGAPPNAPPGPTYAPPAAPSGQTPLAHPPGPGFATPAYPSNAPGPQPGFPQQGYVGAPYAPPGQPNLAPAQSPAYPSNPAAPQQGYGAPPVYPAAAPMPMGPPNMPPLGGR